MDGRRDLVPSQVSRGFGNCMSPASMEFQLAIAEQSRRGFGIFNDNANANQLAPRHGSQVLADAVNYPGRQNQSQGSYMEPGALARDYGLKPAGSIPNPHMARFPMGKENIDPSLGRPNMRSSENRFWGTQQLPPNNPRFGPPQMYGMGYPAAYNDGFGSGAMFGYSQNPLSCTLPAMPQTVAARDVYRHASDGLFISPDRKQTKGEIPTSPDETLSDLDRDDLSQMYLNTSSM
jgi:hypothetical protein